MLWMPLHDFFEWLIFAGGRHLCLHGPAPARGSARARMHAAELERPAPPSAALESRLQAMQARVEPQFLFNTLSQVRDLYRADVARGERMLDELIAYLRAAMPKMRDTSSTVGQEVELVRAYLAIVRLRLGGRPRLRDRAARCRVAAARMPPMMLLPLVDHAIARHGASAPQATESLHIRAAVVDDRIRLQSPTAASASCPRPRARESTRFGSGWRSFTAAMRASSFRSGAKTQRRPFSRFPLSGQQRDASWH